MEMVYKIGEHIYMEDFCHYFWREGKVSGFLWFEFEKGADCCTPQHFVNTFSKYFASHIFFNYKDALKKPIGRFFFGGNEWYLAKYIKLTGKKVDIYILDAPLAEVFHIFTDNENIFKQVREVLHKDDPSL